MELSTRFAELDSTLGQFRWLWKPQPFKELDHCSWKTRAPELYDALIRLSDPDVKKFSSDDESLLRWISNFIPQISEVIPLTILPSLPKHFLPPRSPHLDWKIPGRKAEQIIAFASTISVENKPIVEWCGGKGHLGRLLTTLSQQPVITLERDSKLCEEGTRLSARAKVNQTFLQCDVMAKDVAFIKTASHVVALHACGDLHRHLVSITAKNANVALDLAPCCYHLPTGKSYHPFNHEANLVLENDDLRLAVTGTATASPRETRQREIETAWKLAYRRLCITELGELRYQPISAIDKTQLNNGFEGFCKYLASRDTRVLPREIDYGRYEERGWEDFALVTRLGLVKTAFRRAIETWLVLDMGLFLQKRGYSVEIGTFCGKEVTPRNILIRARHDRDHTAESGEVKDV